jgi:CelD/BcsL family acetyltransferase involved in cellulose biosynthesis
MQPRTSSASGACRKLEIRVFTSLPDAQEVWLNNEHKLAGYVFQSYTWLTTWQLINVRQQPLLVQVIDSAGGTVMLLPLCLRWRYGVRMLTFFSDRVSDYNAPLIDPTFAANVTTAELSELWRRIIAEVPAVDIVSLTSLPEHIEGIPNPLLKLDRPTFTMPAYAATLPRTFELYCRERKPRLISDTARQRRRLAAAGEVKFETLQRSTEVLATIDLVLRQRQRKYGDIYTRKDFKEFWRSLGELPSNITQVHASRLLVGDKIIAAHVGAASRTRFYWLIPGYDQHWARYSPGRILMLDVIKWCIGQKFTTFDLTVGGEEYKSYWCDERMPIYNYRRAVTLNGAAMLRLRPAGDWLRRKLSPLDSGSSTRRNVITR